MQDRIDRLDAESLGCGGCQGFTRCAARSEEVAPGPAAASPDPYEGRLYGRPYR